MTNEELEYYRNPEVWPEFMRSALLPRPPRQAPDWDATAAPVNARNAGISGGLAGEILTKLLPPAARGTSQQSPAWLAGAQLRGAPASPAWPQPPQTQAPQPQAPTMEQPSRSFIDAVAEHGEPLFQWSGMYPMPPSGHRAPPSLDLSDPWAVAAYKQSNAVRPMFGRGDPERAEAAIRAGLVSAADPFGITSWLIGQVSPATKDLIRAQYEDHPIPSMIGSLATSAPRSVVTAFEAAAKAAPKTMTGLLGLGGATFFADEAEAGKRPRKFGKGWRGPSATDKFWRDIPTKLDEAALKDAVWLDPATLRWSQRTAGGGGRAELYRPLMREQGYIGNPLDLVWTPDGLVTLDHTRAVLALELGIRRVPARVHDPSDLVPPDMYNRFGRKTWGQVLAERLARQTPPLPPTGTTVRPRLPRARK